MVQRGRKSAASLSVVPDSDKKIVELTKRPAPWPGLNKRERELWVYVVDALPADWFGPGDLPLLMAYGLSLGTMNFVFYQAIRTIPLGIAVGLEFTGPLAVALLASRRHLDFLWLALAVLGVGLLLPLSGTDHAVDLTGVGFALAAGVCWALYIVFGQRAGRAMGAAAPTWGMLIAACEIVPLGFLDAGTAMVGPAVLPLGFAVAVLSSALPYSLEMIALRRLTAKTYGTLMSVEPALAALAGLVLLGEQLSHTQWLGIGAVMVASIGTLGNEPTADQVP